jgi:hypothetical protein
MQGGGELEDHAYRRLPLTALDQADKRTINLCRERELFLCQADFLANRPQYFPEP